MLMYDRFQHLRAESAKSGADAIVALLNRVLAEGAAENVSDIHFQPQQQGVEIRFRLDGVLRSFGWLEPEYTAQIAARLKVLAQLLTYKTDTPQEGRVRSGTVPGVDKEMRISTAATLYGERVVVRFFAEENRFRYPDELGFTPEILDKLRHALRGNSGAVLITGPSGSGKTTTAYALLRELVDRGETLRSVITLEDPIEHAIDRIAQLELNDRNSLSLGEMIKYMLRQDPEVLFVGEIRDSDTAQSAMQAALTGHLLITTLHAGTAIDAVVRLCDMGLEPFILRSGITFVSCQRLARKLCSECREIRSEPLSISLAGEVYHLKFHAVATGCPKCNSSGYSGRILLAESLPLADDRLMRSLLDRSDTKTIRDLAVGGGMVPMTTSAVALMETHLTSPQEIRRVFGK